MKITVLGTGMVGTTLAGKLSEIGNEVAIGTRDPEATKARTEPGAFGGPSFSAWYAEHPDVAVKTFAEAAADAEWIVVATNGNATLPALEAAGAESLSGKLVIDVSNPLDFSDGFPPSLFTTTKDSLGEQIQKAYPDAKVVKTLNTVSAPLMVAPTDLADGDHTMFVCGEDAGAKETVTAWLKESFGWKDVLDLGGIDAARGTEAGVVLWARIWGATQLPAFAFKIVR